MTRRNRPLITVGIATAILPSSCSDASNIDLGGVFAEEVWELATNPRDVTTDTCVGEPRCQQAYETDQAKYLKFDSTEDAEKALVSSDNARRSRAIVVTFKDSTLTEEQKQQIFEVIDGTHQS